jgi:autotransporter-associated beta strand protein
MTTFSVSGGTITTAQPDNSTDDTGTGGGFVLRPNTATDGDTVAVSGVSISNSSGTGNGNALNFGYGLPSSGSYSVSVNNSTLESTAGSAAFLAYSSGTGTVTYDSTGGPANTIDGSIGINVGGQTGNVSAVIKTGADIITTSGFTGEILYAVATGTGSASIDSAGATLTGGGLYGVVGIAGSGGVTIGGSNGGFASSVVVTNGYGIYTGGNGNAFPNVSITLASSGSISAREGMRLNGQQITIDSYGSIAGSVQAINANSAQSLTLTLRAGSVTSGNILTTVGDDTINIYTGADVANASFEGVGGSDKIYLRGAGSGTLDLFKVLMGPLFKVDSGTWTLSGMNGRGLDIAAGTIITTGNVNIGGLSGSGGTLNTLGPGTVTVAGSSTPVATQINGMAALQKVGSNVLTLTGNNTYSGGTVVVDGLLNFSSLSNLGSGNITLSGGGGLQWAAGNTTDISARLNPFSNAAFDTNGNDVLFSSALSGSNPNGSFLTKKGSGTLTLTGVQSYATGTIIEGGTLRLAANAHLAASAFMVINGGTFDVNGNTQLIDYLSGNGGSIALGAGNLAINQHLDGTFAGTITGTGSVTLNTGRLFLTGDSTYSGGTNIVAGALFVGADSTTGSITGNVSIGNAGYLMFQRSNTASFGGIISGSGQVVHNGTGTLILSGNNTYTGGTTLNRSGALRLENSNAAGTGTINILVQETIDYANGIVVTNPISGSGIKLQASAGVVATQAGQISAAFQKLGGGTLAIAGSVSGGATVSAGTLQIGNGGAAGSITGNITDNATLVFNRNDTLPYAGAISGTGSVTQAGTGVTILTGTNTYTGGTTINSGATLQIGNAGTSNVGTSGSISGNVTNNGILTFDRHDDVTFGGVISGSGSLTKIGTGGLTLTGANTYTGGTALLGGALLIGNGGTTGSIAGDIFDGNVVAFNRSDSVTFGGVISGYGALLKFGAGSLTLSGINTYSGDTAIIAGTLNVTGAIAGSNVSIGATLSGSGTVGTATILSGGTLAPGDAPGVISNLHVSGNLTFQGGALSEDISAAAADQIIVSGSVSLGGQLAANFAGGGYGQQTFTLLHANGGLSGAFANVVVTGLPAGLDAHVTYDANNVYLTTEPPPNISIGNASVGEGGVLHFGVSLDQASSRNITLSYDTFAGTASMANNDYLGGTGTLTILAGQTTGTINVQTVSDSNLEPDETMSVHLLTASFGVLTQAVGTGTIVNVVPPNISIGNDSVSEGGVLHFWVTLDAAAAQNITLSYDTFLGTASMADNDYLGGPGTLTILAGQTTGTINLQTVQDSKVEPDETMSVHLLTASFGVLAQAAGTGTIVNDDVVPNITIGNASVSEGGVLHFGVSLDKAASQNITLGYDTFLGTASMADNDYLGGPGSLTILAGQTTGTINLQTVQDSKVEPDETMSVHLLTASFGVLAQAAGTGTIVNDDVVPNISLGNASVTEGGLLHFGVTLDQAATQNITLGYDTFLGTASMANNDYLGGPGTLTILAGQTTGTINIQTMQDSTVEPDETMSVHLLNASFGNITQGIGTGTIVNDDVAPTPPNISIGDATVTEGDVLHFGVSLDKAASQNITLGYDTFAGSASMADNDYLGGPGTLTILAGQTSGTIDIQTVQDSKFEGIAETMQVHLLTANFGAITQGTGRGAIFDDDALPSASISNASVLEGGILRFAVSVLRPATQNVTLSYDTFAGTASMADNDYLGGPGTLTILAGQSDGFITIQTVQDSKVEPDETMSVRLLASSYGTIALGTGTGTILNTVTPNVPAITIGNSGAGEGGTLQFSVFLGKAWSQDVTVSYDTFAGTASMADNDYLGGPGTLTILAGQTTGTINILTVQDSKVEPNETVSLHLLSTSFGAITQGIGNGVILDDDGAPNISIGNASVAEGGVLHFGVTLNQAVQQDIVVGYDTFAGTASMANNDYLGGPGALTILAGQTTGTINIQTVLDGQVEPNEIMSVQLGGTTFGNIAQGVGVGTILSNSSMAPPFGMPLNSLALAGMS